MLNVAILMGRLVEEPELRHTPNNVAVTTFTIAVDRSYVKSGAERQADFIDIVCWRNTAEFVCEYFRKGQMIALQGGIQTRSYTDNQGIKRKAFEIVADNIHFADSKKQESGTQSQPAAYAPQSHYSGGYEEILPPYDDDLPFN